MVHMERRLGLGLPCSLQSIDLTRFESATLEPGRLLLAIQVYSHGISGLGLGTRSSLLLHHRHTVCPDTAKYTKVEGRNMQVIPG